MSQLAASEPYPLPSACRPIGAAAEHSTDATARVAATPGLMAVGGPLTIPRLQGVPTEYRFFDGIDVAANLAKTLVATGLADPGRWGHVDRDPFRFVERALRDHVGAHGGPEIDREFHLSLGLASDLDPYGSEGDREGAEGQMYLVLEPENAGYVVMGPTLRMLKAVHPRLPVTFFDLFTGALNRWIRVYDQRDALERVEQLREWYDADPQGENVELPAVDAAIPDCLRQKCIPVKERFVARLAATVRNQRVRALLEGVIELSRISVQGRRPEIGELVETRLADSNPPVPALVAVFNKNDAVEGCFDEECQGMLECLPEPNVILPFRAEDADSVREAFRLLAVICGVLRHGARLITLMMELVK